MARAYGSDDKVPSQRLYKSEYVYVDDAFLTKYEKDKTYEAIPFFYNDHYQVSPSYGAQWAFRDCIRIGRNLVKMPFMNFIEEFQRRKYIMCLNMRKMKILLTLTH